MTAADQAAHARTFQRVAQHLLLTATRLQNARGEAPLSPMDVADLFVTTGLSALLLEHGPAAVVTHLRKLADDIERDAPQAN